MKRRDILKALLVLPIVPITLVDSIALNANLKYIVRTFLNAGYQVSKREDCFNRVFYCLYSKNHDLHDEDDYPLEVGIFEVVTDKLISDCKEYEVDVPKQSEKGTFVFGNLDETLPKEFEHLFSYVSDW